MQHYKNTSFDFNVKENILLLLLVTELCQRETTVTCNGKHSRRCHVPGAKFFSEVNLVHEISNGKCEAKKGYSISRNGKKFIVRRKCEGEFHVKYLSEGKT